MRFKKIKTVGNLAAAIAHDTRERKTLNADEKKLEENVILKGESVEQSKKAFDERIQAMDKPPRKNAVLAVDYMISATNNGTLPGQRENYLRDALKWVEQVHGAENVIHASIHKDEKTDWHLHAIVVPLRQTEKGLKLQAKNWFDGVEKIQKLQTSFHKQVGERYGLARGIKGSVAKHETVKKYYGMINLPPTSEDKAILDISVPETVKTPPTRKILDQWVENLQTFIRSLKDAFSKAVMKERKAEFDTRRAKSDRKTLELKNEENRALQVKVDRIPELKSKIEELTKREEQTVQKFAELCELIAFGSQEAFLKRKDFILKKYAQINRKEPVHLPKSEWDPNLTKKGSFRPNGIGGIER